MSIVVTWRDAFPKVHLATPGNHRALCGADVLTASQCEKPCRDETCRICIEHADRYGITVPASRGAAQSRDSHTIPMTLSR